MQHLRNHRRLRATLITALAVGVLAVSIVDTAAITRHFAARSPQAAPRVLATFMVASFNGPCGSCNSLSFTANGPFDMIASCQPYLIFADSAPAYQLQLFNSTGHLLDTLQESCGDPNQDIATTVVIPESLAAGRYQLQVSESGAPITVLILDTAA